MGLYMSPLFLYWQRYSALRYSRYIIFIYDENQLNSGEIFIYIISCLGSILLYFTAFL